MEAQDSLSAVERIFSLIDEPVTITDQLSEGIFGELKGEIEFKDIHFSYIPDKPILENFNLRIPAGQSVAIIGATGSGKTTTLYSALELIKSVERKIITVEDPVEYQLGMIHQVAVGATQVRWCARVAKASESV